MKQLLTIIAIVLVGGFSAIFLFIKQSRQDEKPYPNTKVQYIVELEDGRFLCVTNVQEKGHFIHAHTVYVGSLPKLEVAGRYHTPIRDTDLWVHRHIYDNTVFIHTEKGSLTLPLFSPEKMIWEDYWHPGKMSAIKVHHDPKNFDFKITKKAVTVKRKEKI